MKGHTNNPNGRKKGIPNKVTTDLRQWIHNFLNENRKTIENDWKALDGKDRIILFEKLLKYAVPHLQAVQILEVFEKLPEDQIDLIINNLKTTMNENKSRQN